MVFQGVSGHGAGGLRIVTQASLGILHSAFQRMPVM